MKSDRIFGDARMNDQQSDAAYESKPSAEPIFKAAWRGRFNIPRQNLNINIAAHVFNNACLEVANMMPESLCLEIIPRVEVWPASFKSSPPTEHSVALFFVPDGRDEEVFDSLLNYAICGDLALQAMIGNAELLIFTSLQLPGKLHRFHGKPYLWGVFKGQRVASSHQPEHQLHIRTPIVRLSLSANSCGQRSFEGKESPITTSGEHSPSAKVDRRGRRLDDAWQYAQPLDVLRQKAECKYCGFISSHGGISRLKAHLGGGHPKIRLPGCDKVSPEVKEVMSEWFGEWVKKTKAVWTKEIRAEPAAHVDERGSPNYAAWENAEPLEFEGPKADSKYFSFNFSSGRISHHKVDLGGGSQKMPVEAWSTVSPEIKGVTAKKFKKSTSSVSPHKKGDLPEWARSSAASKMKESQAGTQADRRGRPLDNAWEHAKPLDEARQKTQCNYCGFISMYGGISRLKAHLGGGCSRMQLQGCPQVSLEVKTMMEEWFNEWVKYSTATWTRKSNGGKPLESHEKAAHSKALKRGRSLEETWEHAIPLDEKGLATKCKHCGFISKRGGIARLRAHLAGGDLATQLEGCANVPPEVRSVMMPEGSKKYRKKSKGANMETVRETDRTENEAHWFERRHHILQETLHGIRNTCLKESIQKLIEEKNANLQKMQYEIHSLENRLASMP